MELRIYETKARKQPFLKWFKHLKDSVIVDRIQQRVDGLSTGYFGDCKYLEAGIYEMRLHFGSGYRVYFAQHQQRFILLLMGGNKNTQKEILIKPNNIGQILRSGVMIRRKQKKQSVDELTVGYEAWLVNSLKKKKGQHNIYKWP